jgi:hypothetical protein
MSDQMPFPGSIEGGRQDMDALTVLKAEDDVKAHYIEWRATPKSDPG